MRRIARHPLDASTQAALDQRQRVVDERHGSGILDVTREWNSARKTLPLSVVLTTLKAMMGARERCMYCLDSHGTDIEHFWPKMPYPQHMFTQCATFRK
jgi:hypothetical protein